jgi:hypothetical protein
MEATKSEKQIKHSHPFIAPKSYPWLIICDGKHRDRQIFYDISNNRYDKKSIPEMCNKLIYACSHGWLVLVDSNSKDCCLWNPISLEKVQLPRLESIDYRICTLSSSPSDPKCHILFFHPRKDSLLVCQLGDLEFNKQENLVFGNEYYTLWNVTVVGKTIYCMTDPPSYSLVRVEFVGPKVEFTRLIMEDFLWPSPPDMQHFTGFLVECCGELFLVHMMYFGLMMEEVYGFLVFRMDFAKKRWVRLKSIGEHTIFVCQHHRTCCMYSLAKELGIKSNSIYYTREQDRFLYVFDMENLSVSKWLPCPIVSRDSVLYWAMI